MKVVKNINNNVSLCLDNEGHEVVAFGKGIGFRKPPAEIPLDDIQRTFYDIDPKYLSVIANIDPEILDVSTDIVDYATRKLGHIYTSNIIFTLADHIQFAIKRQKENLNIKLPIYYEVKTLYPNEMKIGLFAISLIETRLEVKLPIEEAANIVLHLIDYGLDKINVSKHDEKSVIDQCTEVVEKTMGVKIDKKGFNYSRFVTHMYYLLDRVDTSDSEAKMDTSNAELLNTLKDRYQEAYQCALNIRDILKVRLSKDELVYLIIHINRLCLREDCN